MELKNLEYNDSYLDYLNGTCVTSCYTGINTVDCELNIKSPTINNCYTGMKINNTIFNQSGIDCALIFMNNYDNGLVLSNSDIIGNGDHTIEAYKNIFNCNADGLRLLNSSTAFLQHTYSCYNNRGILSFNSTADFSGDRDINTKYSLFGWNVGNGLRFDSGGRVNFLFIHSTNNGKSGLVLSGSSGYSPGRNINTPIFENNTLHGVHVADQSSLVVFDLLVKNNTVYGIHADNRSVVDIRYCEINNNGSDGIYIWANCELISLDINNHDNGSWYIFHK
jgi:hypothetical protein